MLIGVLYLTVLSGGNCSFRPVKKLNHGFPALRDMNCDPPQFTYVKEFIFGIVLYLVSNFTEVGLHTTLQEKKVQQLPGSRTNLDILEYGRYME